MPPSSVRVGVLIRSPTAKRQLELRLEPLDRDVFGAGVEHGLKAAGASYKDLADQAMEMLFRSSRGVLRGASKTLRTAIRLATGRGQAFLDEPTVQAALDELGGSA
jgi:hypothetical protein